MSQVLQGVREKKLSAEDLPQNPVETWDDDTLKAKWVSAYQAFSDFEENGALRLIEVHAIHDELVRRGIDPVAPLEARGIYVTGIEVIA